VAIVGPELHGHPLRPSTNSRPFTFSAWRFLLARNCRSCSSEKARDPVGHPWLASAAFMFGGPVPFSCSSPWQAGLPPGPGPSVAGPSCRGPAHRGAGRSLPARACHAAASGWGGLAVAGRRRSPDRTPRVDGTTNVLAIGPGAFVGCSTGRSANLFFRTARGLVSMFAGHGPWAWRAGRRCRSPSSPLDRRKGPDHLLAPILAPTWKRLVSRSSTRFVPGDVAGLPDLGHAFYATYPAAKVGPISLARALRRPGARRLLCRRNRSAGPAPRGA